MLKIFEQIFGRDTPAGGRHPEELVRRAIERVVDATDPRIRILSSYRKKLRPAVIHAIDHAIALVDGLDGPVPMSERDWPAQPMLAAMFASPQSLRSAIRNDGACRDFAARGSAAVPEPINALLLARMSQKHTYGYDLVGDRTVSDAPLVVASFDDHRLLALAASPAETRRLLQLRAFDYLSARALKAIVELKEYRQDLSARRKMLQIKLDILSRSSGSLAQEPRTADRGSLQKKMDDVEAALSEAGADDTVLERNLEIAAQTLADAEQQLCLENRVLYLDNLHYVRAADDPRAMKLQIQVLRNAEGNELAAQRVELPLESLHAG